MQLRTLLAQVVSRRRSDLVGFFIDAQRDAGSEKFLARMFHSADVEAGTSEDIFGAVGLGLLLVVPPAFGLGGPRNRVWGPSSVLST